MTLQLEPPILAPFQRQVYNSLHSLSHLGICVTQQLITSCSVWQGININVQMWSRACLHYQRFKVHWHSVTLLSTFASPDIRIGHIHTDLSGPLPPSRGYTYLLTCNDHYASWPEAIPIPDITAETLGLCLHFWLACSLWYPFNHLHRQRTPV